MDDSYPRPDTPADLDPLDFTDGSDCGRVAPSEWCFYDEPHVHGFACDSTCPCRTKPDGPFCGTCGWPLATPEQHRQHHEAMQNDPGHRVPYEPGCGATDDREEDR